MIESEFFSIEQDGKRVEGFHLDGVQVGEIARWYESGLLELHNNNVSGKESFYYSWYDEDGDSQYNVQSIDRSSFALQPQRPQQKVKSESCYINDTVEKRIGYYPDGTIEMIVHYLDKKKHGLCETFYPNGKIETRRNMQHDKNHGLCEEFNEDGSVKSSCFWDDGVLIMTSATIKIEF